MMIVALVSVVLSTLLEGILVLDQSKKKYSAEEFAFAFIYISLDLSMF